MVSRKLSLHATLRRYIEIDEMRTVEETARRDHLVERFSAALQRASELAAALSATGAPAIRDGDFHYLEVLREAAGGPAATIPLADD